MRAVTTRSSSYMTRGDGICPRRSRPSSIHALLHVMGSMTARGARDARTRPSWPPSQTRTCHSLRSTWRCGARRLLQRRHRLQTRRCGSGRQLCRPRRSFLTTNDFWILLSSKFVAVRRFKGPPENPRREACFCFPHIGRARAAAAYTHGAACDEARCPIDCPIDGTWATALGVPSKEAWSS